MWDVVEIEGAPRVSQRRVKVGFGEEIRCFLLCTDVTFEDLARLIDEIFGLVPSTYALKYTDVEGDLITLSTDRELCDLLRTSTCTPRLQVCGGCRRAATGVTAPIRPREDSVMASTEKGITPCGLRRGERTGDSGGDGEAGGGYSTCCRGCPRQATTLCVVDGAAPTLCTKCRKEQSILAKVRQAIAENLARRESRDSAAPPVTAYACAPILVTGGARWCRSGGEAMSDGDGDDDREDAHDAGDESSVCDDMRSDGDGDEGVSTDDGCPDLSDSSDDDNDDGGDSGGDCPELLDTSSDEGGEGDDEGDECGDEGGGRRGREGERTATRGGDGSWAGESEWVSLDVVSVEGEWCPVLLDVVRTLADRERGEGRIGVSDPPAGGSDCLRTLASGETDRPQMGDTRDGFDALRATPDLGVKGREDEEEVDVGVYEVAGSARVSPECDALSVERTDGADVRESRDGADATLPGSLCEGARIVAWPEPSRIESTAMATDGPMLVATNVVQSEELVRVGNAAARLQVPATRGDAPVGSEEDSRRPGDAPARPAPTAGLLSRVLGLLRPPGIPRRSPMSALVEMGFTDVTRNQGVLEKTGGDIGEAVDLLLE